MEVGWTGAEFEVAADGALAVAGIAAPVKNNAEMTAAGTREIHKFLHALPEAVEAFSGKLMVIKKLD